MTHAYKPKWIDFANQSPPLGPILPLTDAQRTQKVSGVLPSGESGGFDNTQLHEVRTEGSSLTGSGINWPYPYPNHTTPIIYAYTSGDNPQGKFTEQWWDESGTIRTYPSDDGQLSDPTRQSGIFHYQTGINKLGRIASSGRFSNGEDVISNQIENFRIFNNYIHHQLINETIISIPYVSTFKMSINWNPYG